MIRLSVFAKTVLIWTWTRGVLICIPGLAQGNAVSHTVSWSCFCFIWKNLRPVLEYALGSGSQEQTVLWEEDLGFPMPYNSPAGHSQPSYEPLKNLAGMKDESRHGALGEPPRTLRPNVSSLSPNPRGVLSKVGRSWLVVQLVV